MHVDQPSGGFKKRIFGWYRRLTIYYHTYLNEKFPRFTPPQVQTSNLRLDYLRICSTKYQGVTNPSTRLVKANTLAPSPRSDLRLGFALRFFAFFSQFRLFVNSNCDRLEYNIREI